MQASNNSPLPKGDLNNQELKTKGTIWKPLIAVSLLSVFSFISGQYLPYVIIAVSGSGAIAAVPLAIFAVSTAIALISTIYLIRLAVSRADNKKEEPQKFVCENCTNLENEPTEKEFDKFVKRDSGSKTEVRGSEHNDTNLENKSSMQTPQQPSLTFGTAIPQNNNAPLPPPPMPTPQSPQVTLGTQPSVSAPPPPFGAPPPPPPPPLPTGGLANWNLSKNNTTTGEKPPVGTIQENTSPYKKHKPQKDSKQVSVSDDAIKNVIANLKKTGTRGTKAGWRR